MTKSKPRKTEASEDINLKRQQVPETPIAPKEEEIKVDSIQIPADNDPGIKPYMQPTTKETKKRLILDDDDMDDEALNVTSEENTPGIFAALRTKVNSLRNQITRTTDQEEQKSDGNDTIYEPVQRRSYIPPDLSREALMTDITIRTFVAHVDEIGIRLGKEIQKSGELTNEWNNHVSTLDKYINSLSGLPWKKILTYSACLLFIGSFLYKMAAWRMLPNFASNLITIVPTTIPQTSHVIKELPKPNIENTINTFMSTPLAPITIVTCIGGITLVMGVLKTALWILRKSPK